MPRGRRAVAAAAVLAVLAGYAAWRTWAGDERDVIRARLQSLAAEMNRNPGQGLDSVTHAASVGSYFTDDVVIDLGPGSSLIEGRSTVIGMVTRLQPRTAAYEVQIDDIGVDLGEDGSAARVALTATFAGRGPAAGQDQMDAREFAMVMENDGGEWRIARVTAVATLR